MTTVFQHCLLVNYAIAPEALTAVLPTGLALAMLVRDEADFLNGARIPVSGT